MSEQNEPESSRMSMRIEGMHCASCVASIEKSLLGKDGVINATVSLLDQKAVIEYQLGSVDRSSLESAVESTGYRVRRASMTLTLDPSPSDEKWKEIKENVLLLQGVITVNEFPSSDRLLIEYDEYLLTLKIVKRALSNLGFSVQEIGDSGIDREATTREKEIRYYSMLFAFSLMLTIPVVLLTWGILTDLLPTGIEPILVMFILTTPIQFISGYPFYKSSLRALIHGKTNMDTLIMLGTSAAYFYSVAATFFFTDFKPFYDTAAMLLSFILLGRTLEAIAKGRTSRAIRSLMDLQAKVATVVRDGQEKLIPVEDVEVDDIVLIKPGDKIPIDGEVIEGESTVDESMITGESIPVSKGIGDEVVGATINKNGVLHVKATKVGQDTVLSQIVKLVEEAQTQKPPIQRKADAIAEVFVPIVLLLATSTFIFWMVIGGGDWTRALSFTIAVLVAACPCALGLATPTAIMVGIGTGAKLGILIKTGEGLEIIPKVDTIVFDKTGTLTVGKPTVTDFITQDGIGEDEALQLVASVEKNSEHPLAQAIVSYANEKGVQISSVSDFHSFSGLGVKAVVNGSTIIVGNEVLMGENSVDISQLNSHSIMLQEQGKTTVYVARDSEPLAILAIADTLKESSFQAVSELNSQGLNVWMITGDKEKTAQAIAKKVSIDNVMAEVMPADKAGKVQELQAKGRVVAFTGDGVNDAPALAQADVGIALGSGTDVSVETGDIVLVKNDLMDVVSGIELGRKTVTKIKQGFFWALVYNIALLPIAAGLLVPFDIVLRPEFAGLAMSLSSVSVVTNALLLGRFRPSEIQEKEKQKIEEPMSGVAIDPICKMEVDIATAELYSDYDGERYYFCAPYCKTTFDDDPAKCAVDEMKEEPKVAIDPICKMDVDIATADLISEYNGKRYYFCAPYCKQTFDANPEQYKDQDYRV